VEGLLVWVSAVPFNMVVETNVVINKTTATANRAVEKRPGETGASFGKTE
jgi:hypothetical protein